MSSFAVLTIPACISRSSSISLFGSVFENVNAYTSPDQCSTKYTQSTLNTRNLDIPVQRKFCYNRVTFLLHPSILKLSNI